MITTEQFISDIREAGGFQHLQVRGIKRARALSTAELRTKKNNYRAVAWDDLGNATVLTRGGQVRQLIGNEYKGA